MLSNSLIHLKQSTKNAITNDILDLKNNIKRKIIVLLKPLN